MKTYAIFPVRSMNICLDTGETKEFTPEEQVGVVTVNGVPLETLLGCLQFRNCKAIELDEAEMLKVVDDGDEEDGEAYSEGEPIQVMVTEVDQPGVDESESIDLDEESTTLDDTTEFEKPDQSDQSTSTKPYDQFIADGLDEKIATVLAEQGCTPESVRGLIAEGFDLIELEDIGKSRAAAILAVYGPKPDGSADQPTE